MDITFWPTYRFLRQAYNDTGERKYNDEVCYRLDSLSSLFFFRLLFFAPPFIVTCIDVDAETESAELVRQNIVESISFLSHFTFILHISTFCTFQVNLPFFFVHVHE